MNTEQRLYIRTLRLTQPGLHRRGVILITPLGDGAIVSASLCSEADTFNPAAAVGIARQRAQKAIRVFHDSLHSGVHTVDKHNFIRPIHAGIPFRTVLTFLGIFQVLIRNYVWNGQLNLEELEKSFFHQLVINTAQKIIITEIPLTRNQ